MNVKSLFASAAFASGLMVLAGSAQAANLLVNGSFDNTPCSSGYCNYGAGGDNPNAPIGFGWTITTNNVDIVPGPGNWGAPENGPQMLDLVGYGSTGGISQSFATTIGKSYTLSFYYANNPYPSGVDSADVTVTGASTLYSDSITHTTSTSSNMDWVHVTDTFTADSTSTTLAFNETTGGGNAGVFLDNVSVAAVPEPATWTMAILGVAMIGFAARRRTVGAVLAA